LELNVTTDLLTPGPVPDAEKYFGAFDVFLNTSSYEGLSVALLEAINSGCPIVTADAGGNREVLPERAVLVADSSNIAGYVDGITKCLQTPARVLVQKPADFDLVPQLWRHLGRQSHRAISNPVQKRDGVLFLTDNLNIGGAQRSLVNLLCGLPQPAKAWLGVLEPVYCQSYFDAIEKSGVPVFSMRDGRDYLDRLDRILHAIDRLNVRSVCFWNVDARLKLLLAKILPKESVRLVDVSPGPFMFLEMEQTRPFQRRIAFRAVDYWKRLDTFVAKYKDKEAAPPDMPDKQRKVVVIPNGVPLQPAAVNAAPLPAGADPDLVIGTACRITPGKRIEQLMDMMTELNRRLDGVNLVIVGGVDPRHAGYWTFLMEHLKSRNLANIHFAGPHPDVTPFLARFKVFVMIADHPGCPNASLEAMAMGIPVVANLAAGTAGQIAHGKNGFLFRGSDPKEMADHVRYLLVNRRARQQFGAAARAAVKKDFSMTAMVWRYCKLLGIPGK
jgi:glycosyltransferase involved in cell wall biosynthesis